MWLYRKEHNKDIRNECIGIICFKNRYLILGFSEEEKVYGQSDISQIHKEPSTAPIYHLERTSAEP